MFDRIIKGRIRARGHFGMPIIKIMNLIILHFWTLKTWASVKFVETTVVIQILQS